MRKNLSIALHLDVEVDKLSYELDDKFVDLAEGLSDFARKFYNENIQTLAPGAECRTTYDRYGVPDREPCSESPDCSDLANVNEEIGEAVNSIPSGEVDRNQRPSPRLATLIRGEDIVDGQIVLAEHIFRKKNPSFSFYKPEYEDRWCQVTALKSEKNEDYKTFIGVLADGTQISKLITPGTFWYVLL